MTSGAQGADARVRVVGVQGSRRWSIARRSAAVLAVGVVGGAGVLAPTAASATAGGTINSPANGASYTATSKLGIDGTVTYANGDNGTAVIMATDPDNSANSSTGCAFQVASAPYTGSMFGTNKTDVAGTLDLSAAYPKNCPAAFVGKPAVNGRWALTLTTANSSVTSFFTTAVPPAAPVGVKATSTAPLSVTATWTANQELDTHAYAILSGQGQVIAGPGDADDLCSGTTCAETFAVNSSGSQSFSVRAYRYVAPPNRPTSATAGDLSADSAAQTVSVQAKPAPSPTPSATAGSGTGTGGGGSTTSASKSPDPGSTGGAAQPGTTTTTAATPGATSSAQTTPTSTAKASPKPSSIVAGGQAKGTSGRVTIKSGPVSSAEAAKISSQFKVFSPSFGIDKLPPLPKLDASGAVAELPAIAAADDGEPTDQGTFKLSLGYAPGSKLVKTTTTTPGAPLSFVADAIGISPSALWRSLAGSLVLLLLAGHVRRWARQPIE